MNTEAQHQATTATSTTKPATNTGAVLRAGRSSAEASPTTAMATSHSQRLTAAVELSETAVWQMLGNCPIVAAMDSPHGMFVLGLACLNGMHGLPADDAKAIALFERAGEAGHAGALFRAGVMYVQGKGVDKNVDKGLGLCLMAVAEDHAVATFFVGALHHIGEDVAHDEATALRMYKKAADLGLGEAMTMIGIMSKISRDYATAFHWFQMAADRGEPDAEFELGQAYAEGQGTPQNSVLAVRMFKRGANRGHIESMVNLAAAYSDGVGVGKDLRKAFQLAEKAAAAGNHAGAILVGIGHARGAGTPRDADKAVAVHLATLDPKGFILQAMVETGSSLKDAGDFAAAFAMFQKAAKAGCTDAMVHTGVAYGMGQGVARDTVKAFEMFKEAADLGNVEGMFNAGVAYAQGNGVAQSFANSFLMFKGAADGGVVQGMVNLGVAYALGHGVAQDVSKGADMFAKAARAGSPDALGVAVTVLRSLNQTQ